MTYLVPFEEESPAVAEYRGIPNEPERPGEKGRWRRFLEGALPWLKVKWAMAEAMADAKVRQEVAKAKEMEARATQEALKTLQLAADIEDQKLRCAELQSIDGDEEEFRAELEQIRQRIEELAVTHGTRIEIRIGEESVMGESPNSEVQQGTVATAEEGG